MAKEGNAFNVMLGDTIYSDTEVPGKEGKERAGGALVSWSLDHIDANPIDYARALILLRERLHQHAQRLSLRRADQLALPRQRSHLRRRYTSS